MKKSIFIISLTLLFFAITFAGGDQRFTSGKVPYDGVFPKTTDTIKKSYAFPVESTGKFSPFIPEHLLKHSNVQPLSDGFIDITKAPYNVDNTGIIDATKQIQRAIDDSYLGRLIVRFPAGIYLVSDQIKCYRSWNHRWSFVPEGHKPSGRCFSRIVGYQLIGPETGEPAIIKLKDDSKVFENVLIKFIQYDMDGIMRDRSNYCNTLRNISIDMGNNPEVSGVKMDGAQYSTIENVKIYGKSFYAGLSGIPGSGGNTTNIEVKGGTIGILEETFRPNPLVAGCLLKNQTECAIKIMDCRGAVVVTGFKIFGNNASGNYTAVKLDRDKKKVTNNGGVALKDGTIEIAGKGSVAISSKQSAVFIKNIYVKADTILSFRSCKKLTAINKDWNYISECIQYKNNTPMFVGGQLIEDQNKFVTEPVSKAPPSGFISKHIVTNMPDWADNNYVNVVTEYGATPSYGVSTNYLSTGKADDEPIQQAIYDTRNPEHKNYGKTVFIPYGDYRITKTIFIPKGTKIIGASKTSTVLQQAFDVWEDPSKPVIETENIEDSEIILSDFYVLAYPRGTCYNIQSGNIIMRDIQTHTFQFIGNFPEAKYPFMKFSNNASGKVYTLCADWVSHHDKIGKNIFPQKGYCLLGISDKSSDAPLTFYQASIEHLYGNPAQIIIDNSRNIVFNALKHERGGGYSTLVEVKKSKNFEIFTSSGHYSLLRPECSSIIDLKDSEKIEFIGLSRQGKDEELEDGKWISHGNIKISDDSPTFMIYKDK